MRQLLALLMIAAAAKAQSSTIAEPLAHGLHAVPSTRRCSFRHRTEPLVSEFAKMSIGVAPVSEKESLERMRSVIDKDPERTVCERFVFMDLPPPDGPVYVFTCSSTDYRGLANCGGDQKSKGTIFHDKTRYIFASRVAFDVKKDNNWGNLVDGDITRALAMIRNNRAL